MFGRYLKKYGVQNTRGFFQYFYIQTKLKVNRNQNCLSTNIFNIQNDTWFLWQLWKLKSFAIIAFSNRKKYDWIFILKEIISWYVSVTCIVSYLHKNEEFDQAIILLNLHAASFLNGRVYYEMSNVSIRMFIIFGGVSPTVEALFLPVKLIHRLSGSLSVVGNLLF